MEAITESVSRMTIESRTSVHVHDTHVSPSKGPAKSRQHMACRGVLDDMNIIYTEEIKYSSLRDKRHLPCDFQILIDQVAAVIEVDGVQHFKLSSKFLKAPLDLHRQIYHDYLKIHFCMTNGIDLLKISYREMGSEASIIKAFVEKVKLRSKKGTRAPVISFSNAELYKEYDDVTLEKIKLQRSMCERAVDSASPKQEIASVVMKSTTVSASRFDCIIS